MGEFVVTVKSYFSDRFSFELIRIPSFLCFCYLFLSVFSGYFPVYYDSHNNNNDSSSTNSEGTIPRNMSFYI